MPVILETPRLTLRSWSPGDQQAFQAICSDPSVMRFVGDGEPWSPDRTAAFVEEAVATERERGYCRWPLVLKDEGRLIGFCGFLPAAEGAEIGWRLASRHWGRGLATEAAQAALKYGFETLGFRRITATVQSGNAASRRVVEKLGMRLVGETGRNGRELLNFCVEQPD